MICLGLAMNTIIPPIDSNDKPTIDAADLLNGACDDAVLSRCASLPRSNAWLHEPDLGYYCLAPSQFFARTGEICIRLMETQCCHGNTVERDLSALFSAITVSGIINNTATLAGAWAKGHRRETD